MSTAHRQVNKKKPKLAPFQKYFQGYTEAKVAKKNGKGFKVVRIYTDPWRLHDMEDSQWVRQKTIIGALSLLSILAYVLSAMYRVSGNSQSPAVMVAGLLSAAALVFQIVWAFIYVTRPRRMTVYDCESTSKNIKIWSLVSSVMLIITAVISFIYGLTSDGSTLISSLGYLVSGAALIPVYTLEKKTEYAEEENDTPIPFDRYSDF